MSDVGRYRRAFPRIFRHPGFNALSPLEQRLTLYLLFGPLSNRIGLFYVSPHTVAEDLGTSADTVRKAIRRVCEAFDWHFDAVARVFYIPSWWRWNDPGSPKILQGNLKDLNEIPPCGLLDAFAANTRYLSESLLDTFLEAIAIRMPKGTPTQYQYQEHKQKQYSRAARERGSDRRTRTKPELVRDDETPDERLVLIARKAFKEKYASPNQPPEELLDVFGHVARDSGVYHFTNAETKRAIGLALSELRQATA